MTVAEALCEKLRENGWKQKRMAEELELSQPTLNRILNGKREVGRQSIHKIVTRFPELGPILLGLSEEKERAA